MEKECFKCHIIKSLSEFYKHSRMEDGHLNKCKECARKDSNQHRMNNLEQIREYDRKRGMLPHRILARNKYQKTERGEKIINNIKKKYNLNNPIKYAAHVILNNAIRDNKIIKQPCEICGSTYRIHGHHKDYYKPLEVNWLCCKHHKERHNG